MKATIGIIALVLVGILAVGAYAMPGKWGDVKTALEEDDYSGWKKAMIDGPADTSQERFERMQGKYFDSAECREEMKEKREAVHAAIEAKDYDAWLEAQLELEKPRPSEIITEDNFDAFIQMHEARMNGDHETAKELAKELGFGCFGPK